MSMRYNLQSNDRSDQRGNKEQAPKISWLAEDKYPHNDRTHSPDARPDSVGRSNW